MKKCKGLNKDGKEVEGWYLEINNSPYLAFELETDEQKLIADLYIGYGTFCIGFVEIDSISTEE